MVDSIRSWSTEIESMVDFTYTMVDQQASSKVDREKTAVDL